MIQYNRANFQYLERENEKLLARNTELGTELALALSRSIEVVNVKPNGKAGSTGTAGRKIKPKKVQQA
jgi:hypothetical protein